MRTLGRMKYSILLALALGILFILMAPISKAQYQTQAHIQNIVQYHSITQASLKPQNHVQYNIQQRDTSVSLPGRPNIKLDLAKESLLNQSKFQGEWKFELGGQFFEESTDDEKTATVALDLRTKYYLAGNLRFKGNFNVKSESGRVQTRFKQDIENVLQVSNATLEFTPLSFVVLEAGILNQAYLEQEMLFAMGRAFAGLKESLVYQTDGFKTSLIFQQSIPSSTSLNTERLQEETTPSLNIQSLQAEINRGPIKGLLGASLYQYAQLPAKVAFQSIVSGNTVEGTGPSLSRYIYEFEGYALNAKMDWTLSDAFNVTGTLQLLENTKAPTGKARGQMVWIGPSLKVGETRWLLNYGQYFAEPDVAPAYYMNLNYGGTNRIGEFGRVEVEFTKLNFKILAQYVDADIINPRSQQFARSNFLVRLETLYVSF